MNKIIDRSIPIVIIWVVTIVVILVFSFTKGVIPVTANILILILICFVCELMDSSLGMGYGTTLTPILLAIGYEPLQIVPTILLSEFLSGLSASVFHSRAGNVDFTSKKSRHSKIAIILALGVSVRSNYWCKFGSRNPCIHSQAYYRNYYYYCGNNYMVFS